MCGIIGYVGPRECRDLLLEGLRRLEYRGYDSAGLSVIRNGSVGSVHAVGNLERLRDAVASTNGDLRGSTGIGHTRWATHGRVTEANAHPLRDTSGRVHIVLNGIVENWAGLRERLIAAGADYTSETDAEVVAHLVAEHLAETDDLTEAVRRAYNELRGHYAFVAMSADHPGVIVGARKECPLVVGLGEGESFIASAIPAFLAETRRVQLVQDDEIVEITPDGARFIEPSAGGTIERDVDEVDWDDEAAEKGGYETFMLKEIHEQADAVAETLAGRLLDGGVDLGDIGISDDFLRDVRRVVIVACGTSYHAGLVGRYAIEWWSRRPVEMDIASEFRYRNPVLSERDLVIGISQSGETADTLAAMRSLIVDLRRMPHLISGMVDEIDAPVREIAEHWQDAGFFLYLGRHVGLSICLEGALKLKEISYIPTDAYAAGEMKHGPIALLDERTPVVCVATESPVLEKVVSNMQEVAARRAPGIAVATEGSKEVAEHAEEVVYVPRTDWLLQPILAIVPLQLMAYYIARARGLNVDQPRNLAKTVTVE